MMTVSIDIDERQLRRFMRRDGFTAAFNKHISQQLLNIGQLAVVLIRNHIRSGNVKPDVGVWRHVKQNQMALFETGALSGGYTFRYLRSSSSSLVGGIEVYPKGVHAPSGKPIIKLASWHVKPAAWRPTPSQRKAFHHKLSVANLPPAIGHAQEIWTRPPRPYILEAIANPTFINRARMAINRAVSRSLRDITNP
jgi:hypothetical protein